MTKAQEVKKALKGIYNIVSCTGGTGTATGWVDLTIKTDKKYEDQREFEKEVIGHIKNAGIELYTYMNDDGYDSSDYCILIQKERAY
ncbi:MAG: hypothetical protein DRP97_00450 [Candidatus Latescibacterota bacterium]|nr:MAG: hypothetical protein DRP97_00450 [Candidatus Latescibacterota bacterium]